MERESHAPKSAAAELVSKEALFTLADFLTIHLQLSPRTRKLVGAAELALMKRSAFLVNTSRGPIIEEAALVAALQGQRLAGAALDVFDVEPLPTDHVLRRLPNVVLTPHLGYVTQDTVCSFYRQMVEDIRAFLRGNPIRVLTSSEAAG